MRRNDPHIRQRISGYFPYELFALYGGVWEPFNQAATKHVETIRQLNTKVSSDENITQNSVTIDGAACQGIALKYIESGCRVSQLSRGVPELGDEMNHQALFGAIDNQIMYRGRIGAMEAMREMKCIPVFVDEETHSMDLEKILHQIAYYAIKKDANLFYLACDCTGVVGITPGNQGTSYDSGHGFVIAKIGHNTWKFFEANRGEVSFGKKGQDNLQMMLEWINHEAKEGTLKEFISVRPIVVREDKSGATTRKYYNYSLSAYDSMKLRNENLLHESPTQFQHPHSDPIQRKAPAVLAPPPPQPPGTDPVPRKTNTDQTHQQHQSIMRPVQGNNLLGNSPQLKTPSNASFTQEQGPTSRHHTPNTAAVQRGSRSTHEIETPNSAPIPRRTATQPPRSLPNPGTPSLSGHHTRFMGGTQNIESAMLMREFVERIDRMLIEQRRLHTLQSSETKAMIDNFIQRLDKKFQNLTINDYFEFKKHMNGPKPKL